MGLTAPCPIPAREPWWLHLAQCRRSAAKPSCSLAPTPDAIAGRTLGEVAAEFGLPVSATTRRSKGWAGTVVEGTLGACAGSGPELDFRLISVELKPSPSGPAAGR